MQTVIFVCLIVITFIDHNVESSEIIMMKWGCGGLGCCSANVRLLDEMMF